MLVAALAPGVVMAQPTPERIAELGISLTPMGSPRAGSEDGRIPEWTAA